MNVGYPNFELKTSLLYEANVTAATLLLSGSIFTSPTRTLLWHWSPGSKQRQSSMAETEETAMEDKNDYLLRYIRRRYRSRTSKRFVPKRGKLNIGYYILSIPHSTALRCHVKWRECIACLFHMRSASPWLLVLHALLYETHKTGAHTGTLKLESGRNVM